MTKEDLKDKILEEYKRGNVVFNTIDGLAVCKMEKFVDQPTEGILYDLNRDEASILTQLDDQRWINDYACCKVIGYLKSVMLEY